MEKLNDQITRIIRTGDADGTMLEFYNNRKLTYDESIAAKHYRAHQIAAQTILEHSPGTPDSTTILDVGAGSGLVGMELSKLGFKIIDGLDPARALLDQAEAKGVYRNLFCEYFTKEPLNIPAGSYDVAVCAGALMNGHIPYDGLHEMLRIVKPGGIICIIVRSIAFNIEIAPDYAKNLKALMHDLEKIGKWEKLKEERVENFVDNDYGFAFVYRKCL